MTMEEYIREGSGAKGKADGTFDSGINGRDAREANGRVDGGVTCSVKSSTEYIVISSRAWNNSGRTAAAHRRRTG